MAARLSDDARALLDAPNIAHLATLMEDGSPKVEPVWVGLDGDEILVTTDVKSIKASNVARDSRVALSIVDSSNPYRQLLIRGRVVATRPDDELEAMDALSTKYLGQTFPRRRWAGRVALVVRADLARCYESPLAGIFETARKEQ